MERIYKIVVVTFCLLTAVMASAQISVDAPSVVGINEQFNVTFTLHDKPSDFEWSSGDDFQLVWGPQTGSSSSVSIINGKVNKSSSYTYTYILIPRSNGSFTLPAARAVVDGNSVTSRTIKIEVVSDGGTAAGAASSSSSRSSQNEPQAQQQQSQPVQSETPSSDIFMRLSLNRTKVVMGEPITATLKLYVRGNVAGFEDAKFPTFEGFWAQEINAPQTIEFQRESVGDKIYNSALLRRWVLIPQKTGAIKIDPAELVCVMQERVSSGNSIFDGFFDDYQTTRRRVFSSAYTVNVGALPSGAPASFTGAVGDYKISASMNVDSLKAHDAASLKVTVSGTGNVSLVGAPKIKFPPDSEVYDTKTSDNITAGSGGMKGSKVFEYPFIPRSHGDFEIPAIEFTYFDVSSRKYVTIKTTPIPYHVTQSDASNYVSPDGVAIQGNRQKDVKNLGEDIHYIATKLPSLKSENSFFVGTTLFWILSVLVILLSAGVGFAVSTIRAHRSDVAFVRTRAASKMARRRLAAAAAYLAKGLYSAFYEELHKALLGYASDKLNIGAADLSKESIAEAFVGSGVQQELADQYVKLIDRCEYARYAPSEGNSAMQESYDKAVDVISSIDDNMKKSNLKFPAVVALLMLMMPASMLSAQNNDYVDSLWNAAVTAYADGNYSVARENFCALEKMSFTGVDLYVNIADSYYKEHNVPAAILYYERALKLDPSDKDARHNIEIARQHIQDRIEAVPELFIKTMNRKICYLLPSNVWVILFFVFLALGCAMVVTFFVARTTLWRKTGFFSAIVAFLLCVICVVDASWQKRDYERKDSAIIFAPVCSAKSAPSGVNDLFVLHEGTKVKVLDEVGSWTNILLADGREGWVLSSSLMII